MSLLAVPILAQALTLGAGDRTEARWLFEPGRREGQAESRADAYAELAWRHVTLTVGYGPGLFLAPLESKPRQLTLTHAAFANLSSAWNVGRTTYSFTDTVVVAERNLRLEALSAPNTSTTTQAPADPGTGAPAPGGGGTAGQPTPAAGATQPAAPSVANTFVLYGTERARLGMSQELSRRTHFSSYVGYAADGGLDREARRAYPLVQGPDGGVSLSDQISARNQLTTSVDARVDFSSRGDRGWSVGAAEALRHTFNPRTLGSLAGGATYARSSPKVGPSEQALYPTGRADLVYTRVRGRNILTMHTFASYVPELDRITLRLDPRVIVGAGVGWSRNRLSISSGVDGTLSLHPKSGGGLQSVGANAGATYLLGAGFTADAGVRGAFQTYQGVEKIPPTGVVFAALAWRGALPLR